MEQRRFYLQVLNMLLPFLLISPQFSVQTEARHINYENKHSSNTARTKPRSLSMLDYHISYENVMDPTDSSASTSPFCINPPVTPVPPTVTPAPVTPTPTIPTQPLFPPPKVTSSPPKSTPNTPITVPAPPTFTPGPPVFLPPIVYPPPFGPPPPRSKQVLWCVAKPSVPDPIIQEAMDYACGSGADCSPIKTNGPCYQPDTVISHASYAFNSYWQNLKETGATCDFGGAAVLITKDPSYDSCHFKLA